MKQKSQWLSAIGASHQKALGEAQAGGRHPASFLIS